MMQTFENNNNPKANPENRDFAAKDENMNKQSLKAPVNKNY